MSKIKGLRQKTAANTYAPLVPFGTDGILVDMLSDLTLEEELKLGGNHISAIDESGDNVIITETFKKGNNSYYTARTTITENQNGSTTITVVLTDSNNVSKTKTITIPAQATDDILTIEEALGTS